MTFSIPRVIPWFKHLDHENELNNHKLKKILIAKQIFLASTIENV